MRLTAIASITAVALLLTGPALAGSKKPCDASAQDCLNYMASKYKEKGWVGIELDQDEQTQRMTVTRVVADSPAQVVGFKPGDVLLALNGVELDYERNEAKLKQAKKQWSPGTTVTYTVGRAGKEKQLEVKLGELPASVLAQWVGQHMLESHTEVALAQY